MSDYILRNNRGILYLGSFDTVRESAPNFPVKFPRAGDACGFQSRTTLGVIGAFCPARILVTWIREDQNLDRDLTGSEDDCCLPRSMASGVQASRLVIVTPTDAQLVVFIRSTIQ